MIVKKAPPTPPPPPTFSCQQMIWLRYEDSLVWTPGYQLIGWADSTYRDMAVNSYLYHALNGYYVRKPVEYFTEAYLLFDVHKTSICRLACIPWSLNSKFVCFSLERILSFFFYTPRKLCL